MTALAPRSITAQDGTIGGSVSASAWSWARTVSLVPRPAAPLAGVALAIDGGSALDRPGREGERWIFAQHLARVVEERAEAGRIRRSTVEVRHDRMVISFVVEPDDVTNLLQDLETALDDPPSTRIFEQLRSRLLTSFAFETDSPVLEMEAERRALLDGEGTPWARPVTGSPLSVRGLSAADLGWIAASLQSIDLHLAIVGAPDAEALPATLQDANTRVSELASAGAPTREADPGAFEGALPWSTPDRVDVVRPVTNSWISVAFPVPDDIPATLLDFLVHRMREEIQTEPPDPWLFDADLRIARRAEGRVIVVDVAVLPDATEDWVRRILETPSTASVRVEGDYFHWLRRRFRAAVLLKEAAPEALAARLAVDDLLGAGRVRDIGAEAWSLSPVLLERAADALGPARVLVYGPRLAGEG